MGKGKKSASGTKTAKTSGGMRRASRAKRALMRLNMKIARWKRNQNDETKAPPKWDKKQKVRLRSRHNEWNTEGLERHAKLLQKIIDKGRKVRV